ncbi:hypothetical protein IV203_003677 [Nitzschia inconspicua]|uniref:Uncharacterized protein n=1 Tax=Nitzschia inconspicua TaxID=303405 RepID=A0A9K3L3X6_9STRA|nr:hypothetical protein IV203_003677 [Nitzschia inconspicua]
MARLGWVKGNRVKAWAESNSMSRLYRRHNKENVLGNNNIVSFSLQAVMLGNQIMTTFTSYMWRHLQAPNFPAALLLPLPVNRKRTADALPIAVAGETIAAMTGFIPKLYREKKRAGGKCKGPRQSPTCVYCRDSPDPENGNSAQNCLGRMANSPHQP